MKQLFTFFLLFLSFQLLAQFKNDYVWILASQGNPPNQDPNFGVNILDFNGGTLNIDRQFFDYNVYLTNSSICNDNGKLLFFSNGCKVYNSNFEVMENGSGLNPGFAYSTNNCPNGGNAIPTGLLIIQLPNNEELYYIFHESSEQGTGIYNPHVAKLYYSIVDMGKNNGIGTITEKNKVVISDTLSSNLHAVKHANGVDWWVLTGTSNRNDYYKVLFTKNGVAQTTSQSIGSIPDHFGDGGGQGCFSPEGTMYARYVSGQSIYLFDFNRSTSELSNYRELFFVDTIPSHSHGGVAFSSNNRFLYMCNTRNLWQFDLEAGDVQASRTLIAEYDGYQYLGFFRTYFFNMRLAPDCKIYMPSLNSSNTLHVIHSPNEKGEACDFRQHEFVLPAENAASIPNFPNYRLGTPYPMCDSTIQLVTSSVTVPVPSAGVRVWPNPASGQVSVELPFLLQKEAKWRLFNQVGQVVEEVWLPKGQRRVEVQVGQIPAGLYFWEATSNGERVDSGKLIIAK